MKNSILAAAIILLGASTTRCLAEDLEGEWKLSLPAGYEYVVTIQHLGDNEYNLRKGSLNFNGIYHLKKHNLVMARPADDRLTEFVWRLKKDGTLVLIEEPPTRKTGARYLGATLTKLEKTAPHIPSVSTQDSPATEPPSSEHALTFDYVKTKGDGAPAILRAKIPGGWLVKGQFRQGDSAGFGLTFVPDPDHAWDGTSLD